MLAWYNHIKLFPFKPHIHSLRAGLSYDAAEAARLESDTLSITFSDIQRNSEPGVEMRLDCSVTVFVRIRCISNEIAKQMTVLSSSANFSPITFEVSLQHKYLLSFDMVVCSDDNICRYVGTCQDFVS